MRKDAAEFATIAVTDLRAYLPALEAGVRALTDQEEALRERFEPTGAELVARDRDALVALRRLVDTAGQEEPGGKA